MKIALLTFLNNYNYGSTLQAYALQEAVKGLGHEAEHLNYAPSQREKVKNLLLSGNSPRLILEGLRRRAGWDAGKNEAIRAFQAKHLNKTGPLADSAALKKAVAASSLLLVGSDQIWNPIWLNPVYFGAFTDKPKAAYAPSLGVGVLPAKKAKRMKKWLMAFSYLSCREEKGAAAIRELTGRECPALCDPVCLMTGDQWRALTPPLAREKPYLLAYLLGDRPDYSEKVIALAEKLGLEPVVLPITAQSRQWPVQFLEGLGPEGFVAAVQGAAHVITDSFHMTAFCALLERPITILKRDDPQSAQSKNGRINNFLLQTGLNPESPDWPAVRTHLDEMRLSGLKALAEALNP
ncbi:MAG: polysaccharide pyruvyl transferase family protein [Clostridia bacterium]|nr:polysaccharide pyruvyl transferase family protein [Clostridia bacterium]